MADREWTKEEFARFAKERGLSKYCTERCVADIELREKQERESKESDG